MRVLETLQVYLGSLYVNDFNLLGRTYPVIVQADQQFRSGADQIGRLQVRGSSGVMLPVSALATIRPDSGPDPVSRYNAYLAADLIGGPASGVGSAEAIAEMTRILDATLPAGLAYEWTDLTYQQMREGRGAMVVFALAVVLAFLLQGNQGSC